MADPILDYYMMIESPSAMQGMGGPNTGVVFTVDSGGTLREWTIGNGAATGRTASLGSANCMVTIANGASTLFGNNSGGSQRLTLVENSSLYAVNYGNSGTVNTTFASRKGQQIAWNATAGVAIVGAATNVVTKFTASTFTPVKLTLSSLSGAQVTTVISRPATSTFILGTNDGRVVEINASGGVEKSISLSFSRNFGSAPTSVRVVGLVYYNDLLAVSLANGILRLYQYSTSTLISQHLVAGCNDDDGGVLLTDLGLGQIAWLGYTSQSYASSVTVAQMTSTGIFQEETRNITMINERAIEIGIDTTANILWAAFNTYAFLFRIPPRATVNVATKIQDPPGTAVSGRIIRIRNYANGRSRVVTDTTIGASETDIAAAQGGDYYEIAIRGSAPSYRFDWRRFNT